MDAAPRTFTVEESEALLRLDRFLADRLGGQLSREKIKKCILEGQALIGGVPCLSPKRAVLAGEEVSLALPAGRPAAAPEEGELTVLYADDSLAVINKPHNLSVHPSPGEAGGTLVNRLLARFPSLRGLDADGERPGIVHRLDKDTTGLMLVALDEAARLELARAFAERAVGKEYLALVYGVPAAPQGRIDAPIGRDSRNKTRMAVYPKAQGEARAARSDYRTLYADPLGRFALLAVSIHSGRTHQIRVHLTHLGHPIVGDKIYTDEGAVKKALAPRGLDAPLKKYLAGLADHQLLHAWRLNFQHPAEGGPMSFCAPPPPELPQSGLALSRRLLRVVLTGNPGCGKSSVLAFFKARGLPVWSADAAVAQAYLPGAAGWQLIRRQLGAQYSERFMSEEADGSPGAINKRALFQAMCADSGLRREVEAIIHPIAISAMLDFWEGLDKLPLAAPLALAEVPLYLECAANGGVMDFKTGPPGFAPARPLLVGVHCPFAERARRLKQNRAWADSTIETMESWQWPEDKKMAACDLIIDNSGSPENLEAAAQAALARLEAIMAEREAQLAKTLGDLTSCA